MTAYIDIVESSHYPQNTCLLSGLMVVRPSWTSS